MGIASYTPSVIVSLRHIQAFFLKWAQCTKKAHSSTFCSILHLICVLVLGVGVPKSSLTVWVESHFISFNTDGQQNLNQPFFIWKIIFWYPSKRKYIQLSSQSFIINNNLYKNVKLKNEINIIKILLFQILIWFFFYFFGVNISCLSFYMSCLLLVPQ